MLGINGTFPQKIGVTPYAESTRTLYNSFICQISELREMLSEVIKLNYPQFSALYKIYFISLWGIKYFK